MSEENSVKKTFSKISYIIASIIGVLILFFLAFKLFFRVKTYIEENYIYSIPMPKIIGDFNYGTANDFVRVLGVEKIVGEETAGLGYTELTCFFKSKTCTEYRWAVSNISGIAIFPYFNEYKIKYKDENKLLFSDYTRNVNGEIDLNAETLSYTIKKAGLDLTPRKVEIVTDFKEIKKLEKHIISKYLRK